MMKLVVRLCVAWCIVGGCPAAVLADAPNVLLIVADDLGYGDLGCTGSTTIRTPHIDALARGGALCTQAYVASSVCSPSRAGLLTGRDPRRFGYEGNLNNSSDNYATRPELLGLPIAEWTIADQLAAAGYQTALIGKWHLGMHEAMHPNRRGFHYFFGILEGSHTYWMTPSNRFQRNGQPLQQWSDRYVTNMLTDEAVDWIRDRHAKSPDQPWLVVASYTAPHTPLEAPPEEIEAVAPLENARRRTYVAMVQNLDRNIGRLMETLDDTRERQNTLIIFLSDNGGATDNASWNGRLSGAKGSCLEGGIRVPMIWNWPAQIPSGQRSEGVVSSLDIVPTVVAAAGAALLAPQATPPHQDIKNVQRYSARYGEYDGQNVMPELSGQSEPQSRTLYWRLQGQAALLDGTHKLVRPHHRLPQLFRPATDPGESQDLAADQAERSAELLRQLAEWEATLPTVPLWDSSPYWWGESAKIFDRYAPKPEPR